MKVLSNPAQNVSDRFVAKQGSCTIVEAHAGHIPQIAPFIRKEEVMEVACLNHTIEDSLLQGLHQDDCTLTVKDKYDVPFAMFGVGRTLNQAYIWMLSTDAVRDNMYDFVRYSRKWTQILTKPYKVTYNFVHQDNELSIRWLKFCGAQFIRKLEINSQPFMEFIIISKNV